VYKKTKRPKEKNDFPHSSLFFSRNIEDGGQQASQIKGRHGK
jgi:hypothetical protein